PYPPTLVENPGLKVHADHSLKRLIDSRWVCLPMAALFLLSGRCVNAAPVGDFFKKVGQSISNSFQPRPTPTPNEKTTAHASRRPGSRNPNISGASPTPVVQTPNVVQEVKLTPTITVLRASAFPAVTANGNM